VDKVDTNIVKDWAWAEGRLQQTRYKNSPSRKSELLDMFSRLRELRDQGLCELGVTSQLYTDYDDTNGRLPQEIEEMIGKYFDAMSPGIFGTTLTTFPTVFAEPNKKLFL
jgi:hypothetical protein